VTSRKVAVASQHHDSDRLFVRRGPATAKTYAVAWFAKLLRPAPRLRANHGEIRTGALAIKRKSRH
jgi:hypothetical protein